MGTGQDDASLRPSFAAGEEDKPTGPSSTGIAERRKANDRKLLRGILVQKGGGSFLRGWRRELDPDGSLDISTDEFIWQLKRLGAEGVNVQSLARIDGDAANLTLTELSPDAGQLVDRMRQWIKETFGDPGSMWDAIDSKRTGSLDREGWSAGCTANGFDGTAAEISDIFDFIDVDEGGTISKEEILFLETDCAARDNAIFKEKMKAKGQTQRLLACAYWTDKNSDIPPSSRSAVRPWMANAFEALPSLVIVTRQQRLREVRKQQRQAKAALLQHLRLHYGSCARAWRRGIDPSGRFSIDKMALRHFCRRCELDVNMQFLWAALDTDSDGKIGFQDIASQGAVELSAFREWCKRSYGSCAAVWDLPEMVKVRSARQGDGQLHSTKKLLLGLFVETLKALGWTTTAGKDTQTELWSALDFFNAGFLSQADLRWLDSWDPPLWLTADPSEEAWADVKGLLLDKYGLPLNAWRHLDTDGQNEVSWAEFLAGCRKIRYKGDMGAAWRFIDDDASGFISMQEFSPEHYELLMSFKEWASGLYGSVGNAFKNFDKDGSGTLTLGELRRACQKGKWSGEVKLLFDCLGSGSAKESASKRTMRAEDISFLDAWADRDDEAEEDDEPEEIRASPPKSSQPMTRAASAGQIPRRKPMSAEPQSRGGPVMSAPDERPASSPAVASSSALLCPLHTAPEQVSINSALPMAKLPEKKKQLQSTYHCAGSFRQRARQQRQQREAAKGRLPWLEKIQRIDFQEQLEGNHRQRRSSSVSNLR